MVEEDVTSDSQSLDSSQLDMSIDAMTPARVMRDPIAFVGTSRIAQCAVMLGRLPLEQLPAWARLDLRVMRSGHYRLALEQAGLLRPLKRQTSAMTIGTHRERDIVALFRRMCLDGWAEYGVDPQSITWCPPAPREIPRLHDRDCPELATSGFDGFARARSGELVVLESKCTRWPDAGRKGWWEADTIPVVYAMQIQAELAISGATHALLLVGAGWNRDDGDPRSDGPLIVRRVARVDGNADGLTTSSVAEARDVARETVRIARQLHADARALEEKEAQ